METVSTLAQHTPAPQLTHYEGLFTKYLQSLPTLQRYVLVSRWYRTCAGSSGMELQLICGRGGTGDGGAGGRLLV